MIGYHPARVHALRMRTHAAIEDLASIDCSEPAAAAARRTLWLTRRNLAELWMPLLHRIASSDAMTSWTAPAPAVTTLPSHGALALVRTEWANTDAWLTAGDSVTRAWSDQRLIDAVLAHDQSWRTDRHGAPLDPIADGDDLFVDAMNEIARRVGADPDFAARLLAAAGDSATLGVMVAGAPFGQEFTMAVARRLLRPAASPGPLAELRSRHALATSAVLDKLASWPDAALELLHDADVRDGLVWRTDLRSGAVREFVAAGLHLSVLADPAQLQRSIDALMSFVPLSLRTTFPPGVAQGIAASVGTHMGHLGSLLDVAGTSFPDISGLGPLTVDGEPVTYADLASLYGRVVRDVDAQTLLLVGLTDDLDTRLDVVPGAIAVSARSAHPASPGDIIRTQIEPTIKALRLVFGEAAVFEQQRIDELLAERRHQGTRVVGAGVTLLTALPVGTPIATVLKLFEKLRPRGQEADIVPPNDALVTLDGVVAREALRLLVADDALRSMAGLDVLSEQTWTRLAAAAEDPRINFSSRGTLMFQLGLDEPDAVLVETFLANVTGTVDATPS